jgi:hypothetical protein
MRASKPGGRRSGRCGDRRHRGDRNGVRHTYDLPEKSATGITADAGLDRRITSTSPAGGHDLRDERLAELVQWASPGTFDYTGYDERAAEELCGAAADIRKRDRAAKMSRC